MHKSKISEKLGQCGKQNMLRPYLKIWECELILGCAVKAISSPGVRSPWYHHNLALEVIMKMHALVSKMKQFDKCASFVCRNNWNGCQIVIYLINNFKILGQQKIELHAMCSLHYSTLNQDCVSF